MNEENQYSITAWADATFGKTTPHAAFMRCAEEFAEMARSFGFDAMAADIERCIPPAGVSLLPGTYPLLEPTECVDVLITLCRIVSCLGHDFGDLVDRKMQTNRARIWAVTADGVGQHVDE